jgi:hypothetical protein
MALPLAGRTRVSAPHLLTLSRYRQAKNGKLPRSRHIHSIGFVWIRQVERLAVLAAIYFRLVTPSLPHIAAGLLDDIVVIKPMLKMSAAELALGVFLIAGALAGLLVLNLVIW